MFDGLDRGAQVLLIGGDDLLTWHDRLRPHLQKMADGSGGRFRMPDIFAEISRGHMQAWLAIEGPALLCVMVTEIVRYPRARAMRCVGISGSRPRRWMHFLADVERCAKHEFGCDIMEALHHPAHGRLLRTGGWSSWHILSEKRL